MHCLCMGNVCMIVLEPPLLLELLPAQRALDPIDKILNKLLPLVASATISHQPMIFLLRNLNVIGMDAHHLLDR